LVGVVTNPDKRHRSARTSASELPLKWRVFHQGVGEQPKLIE
jgi:hypothetical protein